MSLKTSKTVPNEVIIGEDRENTHHSSLIMVKNATILDFSAVPVLMIYDSLHPNHQNLSKKSYK